MTNKKKKRVRALSAKTGMSHQAAVNVLDQPLVAAIEGAAASSNTRPRELVVDFLPIGSMPRYPTTPDSLQYKDGAWVLCSQGPTYLPLAEYDVTSGELKRVIDTLSFETGALVVAVKQVYDLYEGTVVVAGLMWTPKPFRMEGRGPDQIIRSLGTTEDVHNSIVGICRTQLVNADKRLRADAAFERLLPHIRNVESHDLLVKRIWLNAKDFQPLLGHQHLDLVSRREDLKKGFVGTLLGTEIWVNRQIPEGYCKVVAEDVEDEGLLGIFHRETLHNISGPPEVYIEDVSKRRFPIKAFAESRTVTPVYSEDGRKVKELLSGPIQSKFTIQTPSGKSFELDAPEELVSELSSKLVVNWTPPTEEDKETIVPGQDRTYPSFAKLVSDLIKFATETPCNEILCADEPRQLLLGFAAWPKDGSRRVWFNIKITALKQWLSTGEETFLPKEDLRQLLMSQNGRIQMATLLTALIRERRGESKPGFDSTLPIKGLKVDLAAQIQKALSGEKDWHDEAVERAEREKFGGLTFEQYKIAIHNEEFLGEQRYESIPALITDLFNHLVTTGHSLMSCDDPKRLLIGFITFSEEDESSQKCWNIHIRRVKEGNTIYGGYPLELGPSFGDVLRESLRTAKGRLELCVCLFNAAQEKRRSV